MKYSILFCIYRILVRAQHKSRTQSFSPGSAVMIFRVNFLMPPPKLNMQHPRAPQIHFRRVPSGNAFNIGLLDKKISWCFCIFTEYWRAFDSSNNANRKPDRFQQGQTRSPMSFVKSHHRRWTRTIHGLHKSILAEFRAEMRPKLRSHRWQHNVYSEGFGLPEIAEGMSRVETWSCVWMLCADSTLLAVEVVQKCQWCWVTCIIFQSIKAPPLTTLQYYEGRRFQISRMETSTWVRMLCTHQALLVVDAVCI